MTPRTHITFIGKVHTIREHNGFSEGSPTKDQHTMLRLQISKLLWQHTLPVLKTHLPDPPENYDVTSFSYPSFFSTTLPLTMLSHLLLIQLCRPFMARANLVVKIAVKKEGNKKDITADSMKRSCVVQSVSWFTWCIVCRDLKWNPARKRKGKKSVHYASYMTELLINFKIKIGTFL